MRRDQLIRALENVRKAIQNAKIYPVVMASLRASKAETSPAQAFQAYATFMTSYASFGDAEKSIMAAMKLMAIVSPEFWTKLTTRESSPDAAEVRFGSLLIRDFFPEVEKLLARSSDDVGLSFEDSEKSGQPLEARRIKFFIREPGNPSLTVKHFAQIMESVENLHAAITTIYDLTPTELVVGALDSGSDKEFDLLGIAKAVKILSETLLECWNRYRSARAIDTSVSYKTAFEGITLLEKLQVAQQNNSVSAETAESLRRTIVKSIGDLFSNGVYTDAMEGQAIVVPSALPVERRKLLTHTASGGNRDSEEDPVPADDEDTAALDEQPV